MAKTLREVTTKTECLSTHGAAGYALGSYWDDGVVVCGCCGFRITNPRPTGYRIELYTFTDVWHNKGLLLA